MDELTYRNGDKKRREKKRREEKRREGKGIKWEKCEDGEMRRVREEKRREEREKRERRNFGTFKEIFSPDLNLTN